MCNPGTNVNLYKICPAASWSEATRTGQLPVSRDDERDGYIHLSSAEQVGGTLRRHFAGQRDLVLLEIPAGGLPAGALRWETARSGEPFPHLYAALHVQLVARVIPVKQLASGAHALPEGFC
ncbi:MAG TPA: DUF952 domain-containing protein [Polyangiaceae bacterium]|nr:DUF952 domain-containing protein [Polyangiaceae bacterium]